MNNIFVTGANGFLGKNLQLNLPHNIYRIIDINSLEKKRIDISKPFFLRDDLEFDLVIHSAGKAHSDPRTQEEADVFFKVNYHGTLNLCNALDQLEVKPKAFIFISTVAVYGVDDGENIKEDHPLNGTTPYAKSKIQAEEYLRMWASKNNITLSILRLPLIAGPNPPGNLGAMIKGIKSGKYLSIGKANAQKSVVWAEDIADIIPKLIEVGGIYNLTDGYNPSFGELENSISNALGKSNPIKIPLFGAKIIAKIGDLIGSISPINSDKVSKITSNLTFDDSKAKNLLCWKPTKVLDRISEIV